MHGGTGVARVRVVMISKPHIQIVTHKSETELLFVHLRSFNHPPTYYVYYDSLYALMDRKL